MSDKKYELIAQAKKQPIRGRSFMTSAFFWPFWTPSPPPLKRTMNFQLVGKIHFFNP